MALQRESTLAIIPARGGSKSIPRKNGKLLLGKPLVVWSIESALESKAFGRITLATDDAEFAALARTHGVDSPFLLPESLTQDDSSILDVVQYTLDWLREHKGEEYTHVALLEPTFPLRTAQHITEGLALFDDTVDSVVAVAPVPAHFNPRWQFTVGEQSELEVYTGEAVQDIVPRRQMLSATYFRNGGLYAFRAGLKAHGKLSLYGERVRAYVMGPEYTVDIDSPEDWALAEKKLTELGYPK